MRNAFATRPPNRSVANLSVAAQGEVSIPSPLSFQTIFRLLLQRFGAILEKTTNGHHYQPRHLRRVTVETWLRCQGLISVPQNQMCDPFYQNFALTIELVAQLA